ncbi:hypothetical protein OVA13_02680 [Pseudoxanthomonas sp. SL93]|uniref:hypothetical protein n=1 Tax=Pseudoxanthomonas sp. SL93 TaxID=2995142 RepID=UPI002271B0B5|nr:hypothetical protein [Pseudoxanthomonas sp. SL93]WAC63715.1 hypothetical protein OVA13_02680 [Pseudoxanthomonas sp. SL93]
MTDQTDQIKVLAFALYEMRLLLAGYLGSDNPGDHPVRVAAHLAYALHNQAHAAWQYGESFDAASAISSIASVDKLLGSNLMQQFAQAALPRGQA